VFADSLLWASAGASYAVAAVPAVFFFLAGAAAFFAAHRRFAASESRLFVAGLI